MTIEAAKFTTAEHSHVAALVDGQLHCFSASEGVAIWDYIVANSIPVAAFAAPPATADDVRAEAQRRIIAITGTTDIIGCLIRQHNAQMRATELTLIQAQGGTWTEAEAAEAAALQGLADAIKAIRAASNVLEVMDPIPTNYADNSLWP